MAGDPFVPPEFGGGGEGGRLLGRQGEGTE